MKRILKIEVLIILLMASATFSFMNNTINELEEENDKLREDIDSSDKKIDELKEDVVNLKKSIEDKDKEIEKKNKEINKKDKKINKKKKELKDKEKIIKERDNKIKKLEKAELNAKKLDTKKNIQKNKSKKKSSSSELAGKHDSKPSDNEVLNMEATHYTAYCDTGCTGVTASGIDVSNSIYHNGMRVVAVDPNVIELGTKVRVSYENSSFEAVAADTGGDIKNNRIDILVNTTEEAYRLGRKQVEVEILD